MWKPGGRTWQIQHRFFQSLKLESDTQRTCLNAGVETLNNKVVRFCGTEY